MRVILIGSEGRGRAAEIELDGQRLRVVDAVSDPAGAARPGPLAGAKLEVVVIPHLTRREPASAAARSGLERDHGWRYRARGEIVSTRPIRADIGLLRLELVPSEGQQWAVGDGVSLAIDRIILKRERG